MHTKRSGCMKNNTKHNAGYFRIVLYEGPFIIYR